MQNVYEGNIPVVVNDSYTCVRDAQLKFVCNNNLTCATIISIFIYARMYVQILESL